MRHLGQIEASACASAVFRQADVARRYAAVREGDIVRRINGLVVNELDQPDLEHRASSIYERTPVFESPLLNERAGRRILAKMECFQPSGSFKLRGMSHLMVEKVRDGADHFVSSSGGNAGLAVALCARRLAVKATVIVPRSTSSNVQHQLRALGANVLVHGDIWNEADAEARALCIRAGAVYVSPFDDPLLWAGHSTLIEEAAFQSEKPDAVVVSVGGGGLLCGTLEGLHAVGWTEVPVIATETDGAASFAAALAAGRPVPIGGISSIAKSLGALQVCEAAVEWTRRHDIRSIVLSDDDALRGVIILADIFRVLVEPACGVSLAAALMKHPALVDCSTVLVVVCGGAAVDATALHAWQDEVNRNSKAGVA